MRKKGRGTYTVTPAMPFIVSLRTEASVYEGADAQITTLNIPVDRTGNIGYPGSVQWAVLGYGPTPATEADFGGAFPSDILSFGPNDLTATIQIAIHGNNVIDGDRHFRLSLNGPLTEGGSGVADIGVAAIICTIIDDDAAAPTSNVEYNNNPAYYDGNPSEYSG